MTELYVDNEQEEKVAESLPVDKAEWPLAIEEKLISQEPYLTEFDINIDLKKVDEQSQVGFGNVTVVHNEKEIDIPIVIDGGEIKPFDVMIHDGDTMPLTKNRVNEIFTEYNFAEEVPEEGSPTRGSDNAGDLTDEGGYLPDEGLYATNSRGSTTRKKVSSFLDAIDGEVYEDDVEKLASQLDDEDLAKFSENGTSDVVKKAFNIDTKEPGNTLQSIKEDDVFLCKEQSANTVQVTKTPRNSEASDTVEVTYDEAKNLIKNAGYEPDKLENLSPNNDVTFTPYDGIDAANNTPNVKEASAQEGDYIAKTASGEEKEGLVVDNMFDFDMNKVARNIFVSGEEYSLQNQFVTKEASGEVNPELQVEEPSEGDTGFYIKTGSSNYWATVPFDIEKEATIDGNTVRYIRPFGSMNKIAAVSAPELKQITKVANPKSELSAAADEVYFVPDDMNFIKVSKEIDMPKKKDEIQETLSKESARLYENKDQTLDIDFDHNYNNYETEKLSEAEAKFVLGNHGINKESAEQLINKTRTTQQESVKIANLKQPESIEKVSEKINAIEDELKKSAEELKEIDVKVAADLKDKNSVDALLALALVNEENIDQFISKIDDYEEVVGDLSEMLLLARLGSNTLPEKQIRDAMKNLETVVDKIREIELIID